MKLTPAEYLFQPSHDKTNKMTVHPAKTQISLGIRPVSSKTQISLGIHPVLSLSPLCAQWVAKDPSFLHTDSEDWWDWTDAQADLSLWWVHCHFVGFVMSWLVFALTFFLSIFEQNCQLGIIISNFKEAFTKKSCYEWSNGSYFYSQNYTSWIFIYGVFFETLSYLLHSNLFTCENKHYSTKHIN